MQTSSESIAERLEENRIKCVYRVFFVFFAFYPLLSKSIFRMMLGCKILGPDEQWHNDDLSVDCNSTRHSAFVFISVFFMFVYAIGIPVTFFLLLRQDEKRRSYRDCGACHPMGIQIRDDDDGNTRQDRKPRY